MPANIAHILIAHAACDQLESEPREILKSKNAFYYLGSLGPDLPSYRTSQLVRSALKELLLRPFVDESNPGDMDASFFLHSIRPHLYPYHLMETILSFLPPGAAEWNDSSLNDAAFAFAMGYVTHIAADQVIHQHVSAIVGPYYRTKAISRAHAECEVYQDLFLFRERYPSRTYDKTIQKNLIDISALDFDVETFSSLLSLALAKAGYGSISRRDVESWVDGILLAFDLMDSVGPYVSAFKAIAHDPMADECQKRYRRFFHDPERGFDYRTLYAAAVDLSVRYLNEIDRLRRSRDFSYESFVHYQTVVQPFDLTSPFLPSSMAV